MQDKYFLVIFILFATKNHWYFILNIEVIMHAQYEKGNVTQRNPMKNIN